MQYNLVFENALQGESFNFSVSNVKVILTQLYVLNLMVWSQNTFLKVPYNRTLQDLQKEEGKEIYNGRRELNWKNAYFCAF